MARQDISLIPTTFEYYVETLLEYLRVNRPEDYQDFLESNRLRALTDAIGFELSLVAYYINANLQQMFLPTATTDQAIFYLSRLVNVQLPGAQPSIVDVTFSLDTPHSEDILIPAGTQIQSPGTPPIIFETLDDITLEAGETSIDVEAKQGQTITEVVGTTSPLNLPNQTYTSSQRGLRDNVTVTIDNIEWTEVDNLFDLTSADRGYTLRPDINGFLVITFGDGNFGRIPPPNEMIAMTYRVGGGSHTSIGRGMITEILSIITDVTSAPITLDVTNAGAAVGGTDALSIGEAKIAIPRAVRSMGRFVSAEDFKALPTLYTGTGTVYKSASTVSYTWGEHLITIYILSSPPEGSQTPALPSAQLVSDVRTFVEEHTLETVEISVLPASLRSINIGGTVYFFPNYREETIRQRVTAALADVFDPSIRDIGHGFRLSDLYAAFDNIDGVDYVNITTPDGNVNAQGNEFIVQGTVTLTYTRLPRG